MLVREDTISILYKLIEECFKKNRALDRLVSVLGVKFAMNNTAKLCHEHISHMFPQLSDKIGELCLERYNVTVEYGSTPSAKEDYNTPNEIIYKIKSEVLEFHEMLMGAVKITFENSDIQVFSDLSELLREYNFVVEQVILLEDKVELYNGNFASYDAHIGSHFWILGNGENEDD